MKDWELHKLDKQTFSLEFDLITDFINDLIKGRSSIAHATEVSKSREKKSKEGSTKQAEATQATNGAGRAGEGRHEQNDVSF